MLTFFNKQLQKTNTTHGIKH